MQTSKSSGKRQIIFFLVVTVCVTQLRFLFFSRVNKQQARPHEEKEEKEEDHFCGLPSLLDLSGRGLKTAAEMVEAAAQALEDRQARRIPQIIAVHYLISYMFFAGSFCEG